MCRLAREYRLYRSLTHIADLAKVVGILGTTMLRELVYGCWRNLTILHGVFIFLFFFFSSRRIETFLCFFFSSKGTFSLLQTRILRMPREINKIPTRDTVRQLLFPFCRKFHVLDPFSDRPSIVTDTSGITICRSMAHCALGSSPRRERRE